VIGGEEKWAFTVMVSVSASGQLLPFQAIYQGRTKASCPSLKAPFYKEASAAGMEFECSGTKTYWSNQQMMKNFVNKILAPYFNEQKKSLGSLPTNTHSGK